METYNVHNKQPPRHPVIDMTYSPSPSPSPAPRQGLPPASQELPAVSSRTTGYAPHAPSRLGPGSNAQHGHPAYPIGNDIVHQASSTNPLRPSVSTKSNGAYKDPLNFDTFGASISSKPSKSSSSSKPSSQHSSYRTATGSSQPSSNAYNSYIKPATPGAFRPGTKDTNGRPAQKFSQPSHQPAFASHTRDGWPSWMTDGRPNPILANPVPIVQAATKSKPKVVEDEVAREDFNLDAAPLTAEDLQRYNGDADKHMQELLSGAIGDGEGDMEGIEEGDEIVDGFADGIKLMPHQVRGVKWMKSRENGSAKKYGGILADDMGLGKTVQTLARITAGRHTTAEKKTFKAGTLIIAPLAVMEQWATEVKTKTQPGLLKVTTHHGPSRTKSGKTLEKFDVVITTFQTVASEFGIHETAAQKRLDGDSDSDVETGRKGAKAKKTKKAGCPLFEVKWLRIVVDEAQNIKNRKTRAALAAVALDAKYRWCLTGTPIQNNVEELFSLFKFLRARPLDNWETFRERITSLVKDGRTKLAMKRLHVILKAIMLRRTKDATIDGKKILNLPGRTVQITPCDFDVEEKAFYEALEKKTELTFNKFVRNGTAMSNYTSVLTMLLRLRQACVHPSLVTKSLSTDADAIVGDAGESKAVVEEVPDQADELADLLGGLGVGSGKTCQMCFVKLENPSATFCSACADIANQAKGKDSAHDDGLPPTSAKIRMLLKLLSEIDERSASKEKTIVFSQFTSFLDLIEPFLKKNEIAYVRYDGKMRNDKRQESLEKIKNHPETRVILISFKAGSTGLNLTCCNNVILMDLWWNPALEDQAFDRAHRLGQKLDVNIFKLTIEETVEDRILELQKSKRELANAALSGGDAKGLMKLTMSDIMKLFRRTGHKRDEEEDDDDSD